MKKTSTHTRRLLALLLGGLFLLQELSGLPAAAAEETTISRVTVVVYDNITRENVENVNIRLVEYADDARVFPEAECLGVIAEWNTSDVNPYVVAFTVAPSENRYI